MKRVALVILMVLGACDATDSRGWLVDRTRLLGARTEADGDPTRASVAVGEHANVTWLVASPTPAVALSYAWAACAPPSSDLPTPRCEGAVLASGSGSAGTTGLVGVGLVVPQTAGTDLFMLGAFCSDGSAPPVLDLVHFTATCANGTALLGTTSLAIGGTNHNPPIDDGDVLLDDQPLPPSMVGPVDAPCTGAPEAPVVLASGGDRQLRFRFHDEQRELADNGVRESLVASHVVSAGVLDRQYSALDPNEAAPKTVKIPWTPPVASDVPDVGRIIELFFVLRDGRGGTTFARRTLCARSH